MQFAAQLGWEFSFAQLIIEFEPEILAFKSFLKEPNSL